MHHHWRLLPSYNRESLFMSLIITNHTFLLTVDICCKRASDPSAYRVICKILEAMLVIGRSGTSGKNVLVVMPEECVNRAYPTPTIISPCRDISRYWIGSSLCLSHTHTSKTAWLKFLYFLWASRLHTLSKQAAVNRSTCTLLSNEFKISSYYPETVRLMSPTNLKCWTWQSVLIIHRFKTSRQLPGMEMMFRPWLMEWICDFCPHAITCASTGSTALFLFAPLFALAHRNGPLCL